ncbi:ABC transporter ATP-binding protein [Granulicella mallensis]|uniref:Xenobiotic-transporting ATPase n=1 Tax=Granulicella mallensis (strain ATCC BAA-1857 / DSM 23137 / MP5ACTX8) TaxID=682795 RepID=G8NS36_GRAMM|nr:ABC transporter ATP-binding protein [Granulicella mallensis]AEU36244.1 Xenobiotic-transporting ATPase [Granulicella mallensis MP5ACTX8]
MRRIWRLLRYLQKYALYSVTSVLLMAVVGALAAFRILLIKPIFDNVLRPDAPPALVLLFHIPHTSITVNLQHFVPSHFRNAWTVVAVALVGSAIIKSICDYLGTVLANKAGFGMITDIRNDLYDSVLRRSTAFFQRHSTGALISTLISDVERVQAAMATVMSDFLQQIFTLVFMIGAVILTGGRMAWVLLLFVPVIVSSARRIGRSVRKTTRRGQDKLAEIQNIVHETITGNGIVKAFGMELWEMNRFRKAADRLLTANMRSVAIQSISSPLMDALGAVAIALLLLFGRDRIMHHGMSAGSFVAFLIATFTLYDPVRKMPVYYNNFQQAVGASQEIFKFIDEQDEVLERKKAITLKSFGGLIEFRDVRFGYERAGVAKEVLHGISLTVRRGEVVALVGPSGAGKSTLVNLLPRFFDVTGGTILLDEHDVRDLTIASLRAQIGKVTQETVLFNDTVRNNIAYGRPDVSMEKIEAAAKAALAHDFILRMSDGYDTMIGERGARLSGGERQRIAIARAILKDAPILILDEATSALDTESEVAVQAALANLMQGRTVLVIAHRLSTVRRADRIAVIERGSVTELGSHDELVELGGMYSRLYKLQFGQDDLLEADLGEVVAAEGEGVV